MSSLSGIYSAPLLCVAYCLTDACYLTSVNGHSLYHFIQRQRDWHLDAANQGASNGHIS